MHRRLLVVSSALMCALAVFVAWVLCDLHDRSLPQELHPSAVITVTLPDGMDDADALRQFGDQNRKLGLGLVKIVPDMEHGPMRRCSCRCPVLRCRGWTPGRQFADSANCPTAGSTTPVA